MEESEIGSPVQNDEETSWWSVLDVVPEFISNTTSSLIEMSTYILPENLTGNHQNEEIYLELVETNVLPKSSDVPIFLQNKYVVRHIISFLLDTDVVRIGLSCRSILKPICRLMEIQNVLIFENNEFIIFYDGQGKTQLTIEERELCSSVNNEETNALDINLDRIRIFGNRSRLPSAFVAVDEKNRGIVFGDPKQGGDIKKCNFSSLSNVQNVYSTVSAFIMVNMNGDLVSWGNPEEGGETPEYNATRRVVHVETSLRAVAVLYDDNTVIAWGDVNFGGCTPNSLPIENVKNLRGNMRAFMCELQDGSYVSWGDPAYRLRQPKEAFDFDSLLTKDLSKQ